MGGLPTTHHALKIGGPGAVQLHENISLPTVGLEDVLVRVACVSISPVDSKSADLSPAVGATSGTEFSGIIVALGPQVASDRFRLENQLKPLAVGDHVVGGVFGNNPLSLNNGAFAEYVAVPARLVWLVPEGMDLATAATLPAAIATVGLSLFQHMKLPMLSPTANPQGDGGPFVLVYGGGTATGCMAIQVLRLAGYRAVTTCSDESAARAQSHGAVRVFDYRSPDCGSAIREYTGGQLGLALDCITDTASMAICYEALGDTGGSYIALDSFPLRGHTRRSVVPGWVCTYTQFGGPVAWAAPYNFDARPRDRACAEAWYAVAQRLLDEGRLVPHPKEEREGGLSGVPGGMEEVRKGKVKGKKLVYTVNSAICAAA
ncbi:chaperonin 10-like protein [Microdochium bolleyi]|uniref:Chaperonin 10-like protein n=1 Tax=Microdochium bolleyi TaxID=196109 RepID=A0A136ISV6_9PEZI|nr:chaperonin 10-like protein [Microdochium bolleyi]